MLTLSADDLSKLPHRLVVVVNGHTKASENYSGVSLSVLLAKVDVPQGEQVKGGLVSLRKERTGTTCCTRLQRWTQFFIAVRSRSPMQLTESLWAEMAHSRWSQRRISGRAVG